MGKTNTGGYVRFRPPPITNDAQSINRFVDLMQRTRDLKARYWPRYQDVENTTLSTTATTWQALTPSPQVSLDVKAGDFVAIQVDVALWANYSDCGAVGLYEAVDFPTPLTVLTNGTSLSWNRRITLRGSGGLGALVGGENYPMGSWIVFNATPGIHTYQLRYAINPAFPYPADASMQIRNKRIFGAVL